MNLANKLTIIRIILVPVFLVFMAVEGIQYFKIIAIVVFIIASITDKLDGYIARSRNQITRFGKLMDPLADKLLVTAALVSLVEYHIIPAWVSMIIIAREFAVTGLRTVAAAEGIVIAASPWGKAKTFTQIIAIVIALLNLNSKDVSIDFLGKITWNFSSFFNVLTLVTMGIAIVITIISGVDYFVKNKEVMRPDK